MSIDVLPDAPSPTDPVGDFDTKAFAFLAALQTFRTQANATAAQQQVNADICASLVMGMALPNYSGTSTSNLTIGTGAKTFVTQAGKSWTVGQTVVCSNGSNYMKGVVTGYAGTNLDVSVSAISGAGTLASWTIGLSYAALGVSPRAQRVDVASVAGVVDLTAAVPDVDDIQITGVLAITGFTVVVGRVLRVTAGGAFTLVNGANLVTQRGANLAVEVGATFELRAIAANVVEVMKYTPPNQVSVAGAFKNLQVTSTGLNANVSVSADEVVLADALGAYVTVRTVNLTVAGTASGVANGLDTGALAASTWYSLWIIWNGSTKAGLLSLSATAPTMPAGYTHKARVGWIRTDGTANKYPLGFKQYGRQVRYTVAAGSNMAALPIMASGALGSVSAPTWSSVAVGAFVPTTAAAIALSLWQMSSNIAMVAPNNSYGSIGSTTNPPPLANTMGGSSGGVQSLTQLEGANIYYASNSGSGGLQCMGWEDNL